MYGVHVPYGRLVIFLLSFLLLFFTIPCCLFYISPLFEDLFIIFSIHNYMYFSILLEKLVQCVVSDNFPLSGSIYHSSLYLNICCHIWCASPAMYLEILNKIWIWNCYRTWPNISASVTFTSPYHSFSLDIFMTFVLITFSL